MAPGSGPPASAEPSTTRRSSPSGRCDGSEPVDPTRTPIATACARTPRHLRTRVGGGDGRIVAVQLGGRDPRPKRNARRALADLDDHFACQNPPCCSHSSQAVAPRAVHFALPAPCASLAQPVLEFWALLGVTCHHHAPQPRARLRAGNYREFKTNNGGGVGKAEGSACERRAPQQRRRRLSVQRRHRVDDLAHIRCRANASTWLCELRPCTAARGHRPATSLEMLVRS